MLVLRIIPGDQGVKANARYHRFESSGKGIWASKEVQGHELEPYFYLLVAGTSLRLL